MAMGYPMTEKDRYQQMVAQMMRTSQMEKMDTASRIQEEAN